MVNLNLPLSLTEEVMEYLQTKAKYQQITIAEVVQQAIDVYVEQDVELSKEEILANLQQAMTEALAGKTRPADEVLAELRQELGLDANDS
jgi:poly(A) polymerase Pap1